MSVSSLLRSRVMILVFLLLLIGAIHRPASAGDARQDSYPPPAAEQTTTPTPDLLAATPTPATYPTLIDPDFVANTPVPIGVDGSGQFPSALPGSQPAAGQPVTLEATSRGLVFLWLSFIAAFLVFLIAVVGAIILFTRRNEN